MAEGVFPKVGGDPLYYSEANKFARGTSAIIMSGPFAWSDDASFGTEMGSMVWSGNQLGSVCRLHIAGTTLIGTNQAGFGATEVIISGASNNIQFRWGNDNSLAGSSIWHGFFDIGSPFLGRGFIFNGREGDNAGVTMSSHAIEHLNTTANIVLKFRTGFNTTGSVQLSKVISWVQQNSAVGVN